ncbi:MAG: YceI family protein [Pseudomonadota bacterium]
MGRLFAGYLLHVRHGVQGASRTAGLTLLLGLSMVASASASTWTVNQDNGTISFSGKHANNAFKGEFKSWSGDIVFDPDNLETARADVVVDLTSAVTGNMLYDRALPGADWFLTDKMKQGRFVATEFRALTDNRYAADGNLTLRDIAVPVTLEFSFERKGATAALKGMTTVKRMAWNIGKTSDAAGAWVSLDIPISIDAELQSSGPAATAPKS